MLFCQWPQEGEVTSDLLKSAVDPSPSWSIHRIKVYGGNKTYGNKLTSYLISILVSIILLFFKY